MAPFSNIVKGLGRLPYGLHELSTLQTTPITIEDDLDTILKTVKRRKGYLEESSIRNLINDNIRTWIINTMGAIKPQLEAEVVKSQTFKAKQQIKKGYKPVNTNGNDIIFKDMRVLCKILVPDYFVSDNGHYHKYNCPFCGNNDAPVLVTEKTFNCKHNHCTGEIMKEFNTDKLNYFLFIKKLFQLKSDNETKQKMREIKEACLKQT